MSKDRLELMAMNYNEPKAIRVLIKKVGGDFVGECVFGGEDVNKALRLLSCHLARNGHPTKVHFFGETIYMAPGGSWELRNDPPGHIGQGVDLYRLLKIAPKSQDSGYIQPKLL